MLEDWINEDLSEIADSVFESLLEAKKENPELDINDSEVIFFIKKGIFYEIISNL